MRGKLGAVEVRGGELLAAAEAHDALFSFDYRARTAALEVGLPLMPDGEVLFVNLDPRAVLDVEWLAAHDLAGRRPPRRRPVADLPRARQARALRGPRHARGARRRPPQARRARRARRHVRRRRVARLPRAAPARLRQDRQRADRRDPALGRAPPARRRARRLRPRAGRKVVAEGIERVDEFQAMGELGVDLGQGFYFGQPTERPMAVDTRLVRPRPELV